MIGIPTETKEEAMDTINMIKIIKPEHPSVSFFTPAVGSYLFDYCKKNDLILLSNDPALLGNGNPEEAKTKA